jgi:hypothetical protein
MASNIYQSLLIEKDYRAIQGGAADLFHIRESFPPQHTKQTETQTARPNHLCALMLVPPSCSFAAHWIIHRSLIHNKFLDILSSPFGLALAYHSVFYLGSISEVSLH